MDLSLYKTYKTLGLRFTFVIFSDILICFSINRLYDFAP